jgi:hypothetical protein
VDARFATAFSSPCRKSFFTACAPDGLFVAAALHALLQALLLHNQVIKHAVYDQVGYVLEQEGDSFTVSFYEPEDAVAFTLQVRVTFKGSMREVHSQDA